MNKNFAFLVVLLGVSLSGCSHSSSTEIEKQFIQQNQGITLPLLNKMQNIDAEVLSQTSFSYQLPIANSVITKREVSGFLDDQKTGKISRVTEGVAITKEHFYFEKGELAGMKLETIVEGKTSVKEMIFENEKGVSLFIDGKDDSQNPNFVYFEEQNKKDARSLFDEFVERKALNGE